MDKLSSSTATKNNDGPKQVEKATKPKFSFLATLDRRMSAPGRLFETSAGPSSNKAGGDFMAFSTTTTTTTPDSKRMISSLSGSSSNLIELEASNKKKKRKSVTAQGDRSKSPSATSSPAAAPSLGSLQRMLQKR
jgi:hypothetical protein